MIFIFFIYKYLQINLLKVKKKTTTNKIALWINYIQIRKGILFSWEDNADLALIGI